MKLETVLSWIAYILMAVLVGYVILERREEPFPEISYQEEYPKQVLYEFELSCKKDMIKISGFVPIVWDYNPSNLEWAKDVQWVQIDGITYKVPTPDCVIAKKRELI